MRMGRKMKVGMSDLNLHLSKRKIKIWKFINREMKNDEYVILKHGHKLQKRTFEELNVILCLRDRTKDREGRWYYFH